MRYAICDYGMKFNEILCVRASLNLFSSDFWYIWIRLKTELLTVCLNYLHKYNINSSSLWIVCILPAWQCTYAIVCNTFSLYIHTRIGFSFYFEKDFHQMPNFSHYTTQGGICQERKDQQNANEWHLNVDMKWYVINGFNLGAASFFSSNYLLQFFVAKFADQKNQFDNYGWIWEQ